MKMVKILKYQIKAMYIFNKSTISNNTSSFLTSIGNNVILNKIKKSNSVYFFMILFIL